MTTTPIVEKFTTNADTPPVQITKAGHYMIAVGGDFGGAAVQLKINMGPVRGAPIDGATYTAAKAELVILPACTLFATISGGTGHSIDLALASLEGLEA